MMDNHDDKHKKKNDDDGTNRRVSIMSHQTDDTLERRNRRKHVAFKEIDYKNGNDEKEQIIERTEPFRRGSLAPSDYRSSSDDSTILSPVTRAPSIVRLQGYFLSRRVAKANIEKPWLEVKSRQKDWATIIPLVGIILGICAAGALVYIGIASVTNHTYCEVLIEDFDSPILNTSVWTKEVQSGGYGNGEFEVTTNTDENIYIEDGNLIIKPTLQNETLLSSAHVLNLTAEGICTSSVWSDCIAVTNATNGTIINPVKSGRINTKIGASIKYGKVEVVAKLPVGDWIWPAIWMLPVENVYGPWPASGEIDIVESRGNNYTYGQGGNDIISSALHWGPNEGLDQYWRTFKKNRVLHDTFANKFFKFGLEWSDKYLYTYVNSRLRQVLYTPFKGLPWDRGHIPSYSGTQPISDPWSYTGRDSTPFDIEFYLILNVAVGGTNGYFEDGKSGKPWFDRSANASSYFWDARDQWYPTWVDGEAQMTVKSVKMWQQCD